MTVSIARINLERCWMKPEVILRILGYKKHTKGYIKPHKDGRFHAIPFGGEIELHFDVTVDNKHMVLPSDYILPHEISRFKHRVQKHLKTVKEEKPVNILKGLPKRCVTCLLEWSIQGEKRCAGCKAKKEYKEKKKKLMMVLEKII